MLRPNKTGSDDWSPSTPASAASAEARGESLPPELSLTSRRPRRTSLMAAVPLALSLLASAHRLPASDQPDGAAGQSAQSASPAAQPGAQQAPPEKKGEFKINVDVNLVVLHATVLDRRGGRPVDDLGRDSFRVYEDGVPQKLSVFSHADIPVTMGIVIDDSGSMREKRPGVNAAALTFVKTSNVQDQAFVVNFNDVYYLDTPGDFASNLEDLKSALDKIDSRGGTALYDAVNAALDHLKLGNRDKKVLLAITDGEDNASRYTFEQLVATAQKSNAVIYCIGLLGEEQPGGLFKMKGGEAKKAAKVLKQLAEFTGGQAYFPKTLNDVESTCVKIAHDIRDQYTLAYYPSNTRKDGTFRTVRVEALGPDRRTKLLVRTRTGYYAPREASAVASGR
jgi:Ca-activated chloride channel homolog